MEQLEHYIEEGTANRGWYTCLKTGKKFRGEEAKKQLEKQKQVEQQIRETLEQEMASSDTTDFQEMKEETADFQEMKEEIVVSGNVDPELGNMTYRLAAHIAAYGDMKLVTIKCCDCGAERVVKPQDVFQVKRCVPCQKLYRNARRAELRRLKKKKQNM